MSARVLTVTLCARDPMPLLRALSRSGFDVPFVCAPEQITNRADCLSCDVLALCGAPETPDALVRLPLPCAPRFVYLSQGGETTAWADETVYPPYDGLRIAVTRAFLQPVGALNKPREQARLQILDELLDSLGFSSALLGTRLLRHAALLSSCRAAFHVLPGKALYAMTAQAFSISPSAVEKNIRYAVERTWLRGNLEGANAFFGLSVSAERGKPTNNEAVAMLSEHVKARMSSGI